MFLSETEIDARLSELRRRRDQIERDISDLLLFRELGRRLGETGAPPRSELASVAPEAAEGPHDQQPGRPPVPPSVKPSVIRRDPEGLSQDTHHATPPAGSGNPSPDARRAPKAARTPPVPAVAFEDDPVAARRYGRAILEAAIDCLREAGRPLHAGEILERVVARGFTLPGHDPVAALNTRLWKRSTPGGPLRRLGDAVYALADPPPA